MADRLHVIMACCRPQNIPRLAAYYLREMEGHRFELRWHILLQGPEPDPKGCRKLNEALHDIASGNPADPWIFHPSDDAIHSVKLFRRLGEVTEDNPKAKAVVFSEHRRDCPWTEGHWELMSADWLRSECLVAHPHNMKPCHVDGSQLFYRRNFIGFNRFDCQNDTHIADGKFIEALYRSEPDSFLFVDEPLLRFNNLV